jgi:titin
LAGTGLQGTYVDNTIVPGTKYWYRVKARFSPLSTSDPSNVVSLMAIAAPTNLTAVINQYNFTTVDLNWTNNATNATATVVERSLTPSVGFAPVANLGVVNSFSNSGLIENTRYFYRVASLVGGQQSDYSNEATILTGITPPSDLTATATSANVVVLKWADNSANESGYRLERQNLVTGAFALLANLPANTVEFTDVNLNPDTRYTYRVSAVGLNGNTGVYTPSASALTFPATPTGLVAVGVNSSRIDLFWVDNSTTEFGYEIWRSTSAVGPYTLVDRVTRQNMTSFTDNTVAHNVMYFYRVRAFREAGAFSAVSNTAVGITKFDPPVLRLVVAANKRVVLEWTNNTPDAEGFTLERTAMLDNNIPTGFTAIATLSRGATTFTDVNVQPGITYFYRLRAFNNTTKAVSANSNIVSAKLTPGIPSTPLNLTGVAGNAQVMLSWNAIADLDLAHYEVYYSSENTLRKLAGTTKDTKMTIGGLENGILHTFFVRAVNTTGLRSEASNTVDLRPSIILSNNDDVVSASFNVYPNPNEGSFKLTFSKEAKPTMITVTNAAGQVVFEKSISDFSGSEEINLSNVAAGIYIVNIVTEKASYQRRVSVIK